MMRGIELRDRTMYCGRGSEEKIDHDKDRVGMGDDSVFADWGVASAVARDWILVHSKGWRRFNFRRWCRKNAWTSTTDLSSLSTMSDSGLFDRCCTPSGCIWEFERARRPPKTRTVRRVLR
jgi:hypothetical protein